MTHCLSSANQICAFALEVTHSYSIRVPELIVKKRLVVVPQYVYMQAAFTEGESGQQRTEVSQSEDYEGRT
jgi:hypothetical protein